MVELHEITSEADRNLFHDRDVLIDAVFGYGLSRPAEGIYAQVINCINATDAVRVAVDMPSGLQADKPSSGPIVKWSPIGRTATSSPSSPMSCISRKRQVSPAK